MWFNKTGNMAPLNLAQAQSEIRQYLAEYKIESIERVRSRFVTNYNFRLRLDFGAVKRSDRAQAVTAHGIRHTQPRYRTQGSVQRWESPFSLPELDSGGQERIDRSTCRSRTWETCRVVPDVGFFSMTAPVRWLERLSSRRLPERYELARHNWGKRVGPFPIFWFLRLIRFYRMRNLSRQGGWWMGSLVLSLRGRTQRFFWKIFGPTAPVALPGNRGTIVEAIVWVWILT